MEELEDSKYGADGIDTEIMKWLGSEGKNWVFHMLREVH